MSSSNLRDESNNNRLSQISESQTPQIVISDPFSDDEVEEVPIRRNLSGRRIPTLKIETDMSSYEEDRRISRGEFTDDENDDENLTPTYNRSPVSSFFHKLTTATSRKSNNDMLTPNTRKVANMVPYITTSNHSATSLESLGTSRNSLSIENADPDVINRGLQVALGDGLDSTGGLWLPLSPEHKSKRDSGGAVSSKYEYDDDLYPLHETGEPDQEGIPLRDIHLNVPSYPEFLATTTTPVIDEELDDDHDHDHDESNLDQDVESGLRVPPAQTPTTPRHQISNAFKKFSARVNGRDDDDEEEGENVRNSLISIHSNVESSSDHSESDIYEDDEFPQNSIYGDEHSKLKEGSSKSHNGITEITYSTTRDEDTLYPETLATADELSATSTRLSGFEQITSRITQTDGKKEKGNFKEKDKENEGIRLFGNSLRYFAPTSALRLFCSSVVMQKWFEFGITILTFLQTGLLSYEQWNSKNTGYYSKGAYTNIDWVLFVINSLHTIEIAFKIISFGLVDDSQMFKELNIPTNNKSTWNQYIMYNYKRFKNWKTNKTRTQNFYENGNKRDSKFKLLEPDGDFFVRRPLPIHSVTAYELEDTVDYSNTPYTRAYLRSSWNRIDFISNISFWISFLLSINQYDLKHHIMLFRSLMCLRILRLTNLTHGTSVILKAVKKASPELLDIALLLGSFWVFFAIIGVQSFKSSLRRHCVWINPDNSSDYYVNNDQFCGSYLEPVTLKPRPYLFNDGTSSSQTKGFRCPVNSLCVSNENPYDNTVSFDNIANSFELVFVVMSANTFTDLMYYTMDSDTMAASLFFIFGVFFLTVWIVNLLIAVIVNAFTITRDEMVLQKRKQAKKSTLASHRSKLVYKEFKRKSRKLKWYYKFEPICLVLITVSLLIKCWAADVVNTDRVLKSISVEKVVSVVLFIEIIVRFCCFLPQWRFFFYSKENIFDSFVALITLIIIVPSVTRALGRGYAWLTLFQIARWYRVVLAIEFTRKTWMKVLGHVKTILDLSLFYFIFLYLTSIITSRFFEGTITSDQLEDVPLAMYNLPNSLISLYAISSTENWTTTLYAVQEYAKNKSQQFFGAAYLIIWFMFSNMIILNIFIAVISENLSVPESEKRRAQIVQYLHQLRDQLKKNSEKGILADFKDRILQPRNGRKGNLTEEIWYILLSGKLNGITENDGGRRLNLNDEPVILHKNRFHNFWLKIPLLSWLITKITSFYNAFKRNPFLSATDEYQNLHDTRDLGNTVKEMMNDDKLLNQKRKDFLKENPTFNTVFYMLPPNHRLRRLCQRIVPSSYGDRIDGVNPNKTASFVFNCFMFVVTVAMVVIACYSTPLYKKKHSISTTYMDWITVSDITFTLLFTIEFIIKIVADGLLFTPNAYLASSWNNIDLIVLLTLWINVITTLKGSTALSNLVNGFKALRALRLLTLSSMSKRTFQNTVISGFWQILNAATISMTLLFPFAIWGLNLFSERLGYCLDGVSSKENCFGEFQNLVFKWDIVSPNSYAEPILHLNNFRDSFLSLFEIISLEGWTDLLTNLMNSTGIGTPPRTFATPANGLFVVFFNFVSTIFILNLFVSVIIQYYARNTGRAYQTNDQSAWYEVEKILRQVKASKRGNIMSYSPLRLICHKLIIQRNKYWRLFINATFVLHTIALLLEVYPSIPGLDSTRYALYVVTSGIFLIQLILVIIARGPKYYFSSKWSWVVVLIICGAFGTSVISFFVSRETAYANINKLFLVGVLLLMIPRINRLEQLLRYAIASFPSLGSLLFTWGILFLVYSIALNQIFGLTRTGPDTSNNINTRTVTKSLLLLFRMSFGEGWNYIMNDFTVKSPNCYSSDNIYETDCGHQAYAYLLFISWNIVSMFIFLNMFVSLIVDNFSYIYHASDPHSYITRAERRKFKQSWLKFDPTGTGFIHPNDLQNLLGSLSGVLSFKIYNDGRFTIPELKKKWFRQVDDDPYSVFIDYPEMNATLSQIDPMKVRIRRLKYERLVEEILTEMKVTNAPGVSFTSVILKVALYAHFEESKCLTLNDFMKRYVSMDKVDARLKQQKVYDTMRTVIARWRYKEGRYDSLVESTDMNKPIENFDIFGIDKPKAPLIFISEYLRSDGDMNVLQDNTNKKNLSRNNNTVYDEDNSIPFENPFLDEDAVDPFDDSFANPFADASHSTELSNPKTKDLALHLRHQGTLLEHAIPRDLKIVRNLTGTSSVLSGPPIISPQKTPITRFSESMNHSKDNIFTIPPKKLADDAETGSLMSIDLTSPRR